MKITDTRLKNLRRVMDERHLKTGALATLLGKAPAQVSAFAGKNPTKGIGDQIARELEKALELPGGYLDMAFGPDDSGNAVVLSSTGRKLPVISSITAGSWCEAVDNFHPGDADEWIEAPGPVGPNAFILKIEGISMQPMFFEGDKIVIDPAQDARPGHFVVAKRASDQAVTFKQLRFEDGTYFLYALNPDWPDRVIKLTEEWTICGRARWKITEL